MRAATDGGADGTRPPGHGPASASGEVDLAAALGDGAHLDGALAVAAEDVEGKAKEAMGKLTGDKDQQAEGQADQASSSVKQAGENIKDAAKDVLDK